MAVLRRDAQHIAYTMQRGVMLYYHRSAIGKAGGFDSVYGRGMYEHGELELRIYNAVLMTWAFADVLGSDKLIYSLHEHEVIERPVPRLDREQQVRRNAGIFIHRRDTWYTGWADFRPRKIWCWPRC